MSKRWATTCFLFALVVLFKFNGIFADPKSWSDPADPYESNWQTQGGNDDLVDLLDPHWDPHGFDHANSHPAAVKSSNNQWSGSDETKKTESKETGLACVQEVNKVKTKLLSCEKKQHGDKFLISLLQRHTTMILEAAGLLNEPTDESFTAKERLLILSLTNMELKQLQDFRNGDNLDLTQLDAVWENMLIRASDPFVLKWYNFSYWIPEITISRETFYVYLGIGIALAVVAMICFGVSMFRIISLLFLLTFMFSVPMKIMKQYQANSARLMHLRDPSTLHESIPSACKPFSLMDWEHLKFWLRDDSVMKKECLKFYEDGFTDPMTQLDPFEFLLTEIGDHLIRITTSFGRASSAFFDGLYEDVPGIVRPFVSVPTKLVTVLIVVAILVLVIMSSAPVALRRMLGSIFLLNHQEAPQSMAGPAQVAPAAQQITVNVIMDGNAVEETRLRRRSEPARGQIEAPADENPRILHRMQTEPIFHNLAKILEAPLTPPATDLESETSEEVKLPDSGRSSPVGRLDSSVTESETGATSEADPGSPERAETVPGEIRSPLLTELARMHDEITATPNAVEE